MRQIPDTVIDKASWVDLEELDEHGEELSQWEIDFVDELYARLREGKTLTAKQAAKLEDIREQRLR